MVLHRVFVEVLSATMRALLAQYLAVVPHMANIFMVFINLLRFLLLLVQRPFSNLIIDHSNPTTDVDVAV